MRQRKNVKRILTISLILLILLQSFSKVWIIISFKINQDYIAKVLCVNRDKPEVLCSGKCVLTKNLKADEEQEGKQLPQKSKEQKETTYCFEVLQWLIDRPNEIADFKKPPTIYRCPRSVPFVMRVFHPPDAGVVSLSIVSSITFHFGEQIFGSGKAPKQAYSVLYNCFGNEAQGKKMPPKWKVIDDRC